MGVGYIFPNYVINCFSTYMIPLKIKEFFLVYCANMMILFLYHLSLSNTTKSFVGIWYFLIYLIFFY